MYKKFLYNDNKGFVELVEHMGTDSTVVNSARVSFGVHKEEIDEKDRKLINYLIKHRHTSTLEHNIATFRIKVPLFVRSQHHRHRTWSYNEISRRYTDVNLEFYTPQKFRTQHKSNRQASNADDLIDPYIESYPLCGIENTTASVALMDHVSKSVSFYEDMINHGIAREQARMVLPQNLYTEYYATANLNNILKFIDLRTHEGAQQEIQVLASGMEDIIKNIWPITISAYKSIKDSSE